MKRSIFRPASVYKPVIPFPLPDPQRGQVMRILIVEAKKAKVPPAMLVTHLPTGEDRKYVPLRALVWRRVMAEVEGVSVRALARAFRRDAHQVRNAIKENA